MIAWFDSPSEMIVGMLLVTVAIPMVAHCWYKFSVRNAEIELKRALAERGMSADEIERVITAGFKPDKD